MPLKKIIVRDAEVGKFYFRNGEAIQLAAKTDYCGTLENAFGGKTLVSLNGELELEVEAPNEEIIDATINMSTVLVKEPDVEIPEDQQEVVRGAYKKGMRTGIMYIVDNILSVAPEEGYMVDQIIDIILKNKRSLLKRDQLRYVIHSRIWALKKKGYENIASSKRRYKLIQGGLQ